MRTNIANIRNFERYAGCVGKYELSVFLCGMRERIDTPGKIPLPVLSVRSSQDLFLVGQKQHHGKYVFWSVAVWFCFGFSFFQG